MKLLHKASAEPSQEAQREFSRIYRESFAFVWRTLRHFGVAPAHLEDSAHEVFIVYFRKFLEQQGQAKPSTILYGIARKVAANHRRGDQRRLAREQQDYERTPSAGPEDFVAHQQAKDLVESFLHTLADEQAEAFRLSQIEGMPASEIASILDTNLNTINSRIRTAKKHFQAFVERAQNPLPPVQGSRVHVR